MFRLFARVTAGLAMLAALGACYITGNSVIPAERASAIPGIEGNWVPVDDSSEDVLNIAQVSGTNDYILTSTAPDAQGETLSARGFNVAGGVYAVQLWNEEALDEGVVLVFLEVSGTEVSLLGVAADAQALAQQTGAVLAEDSVTLDGDPAAVLAFLEAHQAGQLTAPTPIMKRAP